MAQMEETDACVSNDETSGEDSDLDLSCQSSSFSEDESGSISGTAGALAVEPYQFEPLVSSDDTAEQEESDEDESRVGNTTWCNCENCNVMSTQRESKCCQEIHQLTQLLANRDDNERCIIQHPGFRTVCLDQYVLDTAYKQYRQQYGEEIENTPEKYRYTGYRQLVRWAWGYLGKNIRVVLPSCAVNAIRRHYPAEGGNYTGFKPSGQ